jgi:predicted HTH transcriptional regulator
MEKEVQRLIREGEHQQQDFKYAITDAKKIARTLVAFANTDGGRLLLGVKDNGNIAGVKSDEEVYMIDTASTLFCRPEVPFSVQKYIAEGKVIVEIMVEPSNLKPHFAPNKDGKYTAYQRVGDENMIANKVLVKVWERQSQPKGVFIKYTEPEKRLLNFLESGEAISFSKACRIARVVKRKAENILANLIAIGVVEIVRVDHAINYQIRQNETK